MNSLSQINWNQDGLVPAIAQDNATKQVLTLAWMNKEALKLTIKTGHAVYWSRSRQKIWHKGEQSGNRQLIQSIYLDCDNDAILLLVIQKGGIACHSGRRHCFYQKMQHDKWHITEPILKNPKELYT